MKLLKPSWVNHDEHAIFSIDVHPDGSRFATGGQGADSGKIVIWNMGPVVDQKQEIDENTPKILCQMDHHIACVNVVRWSNNGLFLASGSDDKLIMIWQFVHGGGSYQNIENWKCGYTLRGHSGDILDLSWSAKDQYLATCSVDNTVIIWNALKFPDIITRINAHAGLVKGVAWDPVGTYFASQSDDKTLKIWKTLDWSLDKCIDEPFKQCTGTTHVLRLNWSPDGQLVISAHAINNGAPTAQVIDRGNNWSTKLDFVGHRKAVTTVRFFPTILKPADAGQNEPFKTHCLCALGSRDRSISIWLTNYSRPLCVIHDLFDNPIMDLSWCTTPNPGLLACSMDGTVCYLEFNNKEIGQPLTKKENEEFFMKKYNHDIKASVTLKQTNFDSQNKNTSVPNANQKKDKLSESVKLIENIDVLLMQEKKQQEQQQQDKPLHSMNNENSMSSFNVNFNNSQLNTPSKLQVLTENQKQIERKMPDGRRRITPICISKPGDYDTPKPFGSVAFNKIGFSSSIGFGSSSFSDVTITSKTATEQSTIIVEKRDEKNEIVEISPVKSIVYTKNINSTLGINNNSSNSSDIIIINNQNAPLPIGVTIPTQKMTPLSSPAVAVSTQPKPVIQSSQIQSQTPLNVNITNNVQMDSSNQTPSRQIAVASNPVVRKLDMSDNKNIKLTPSSTPSQPTPKSPQHPGLSNNEPSKTQLTNSSSSLKIKQNFNIPKPINNQVIKPDQAQPQMKPIDAKSQNLLKSMTKPITAQPVPVKTTNQVEKSPLAKFNQTSIQSTSKKVLDPLKIDKNFITKIFRPNRTNEISIEIHNSISLIDNTVPKSTAVVHNTHNDSDFKINSIRFYLDKLFKWQIYFYSKICDAVCNSHFVTCVCEDSTLHMIRSQNGSQMCCAILLDSPIAVLNSINNYSMCITSNGYVYVWRYNYEDENINNPTSNSYLKIETIINKQCCQHVLGLGEFHRAHLTENGTPVIYMCKNRSYFYSLETQCWHLVPNSGNLSGSDCQLLINSNSIYSNYSKSVCSITNAQDDHFGPLSVIQSRDKSSNLIKAIELMHGQDEITNNLFNKQDFTLTHLESQVNACIGLNSPKEYKFWLTTYARYLVENNYEERLTDLCNFMLGPLFSANWNQFIMSFKKRDLLKEILNIMAQNLRFQRLYTYYKQQLSSVSESNKKPGSSSVLERLNASARSLSLQSLNLEQQKPVIENINMDTSDDSPVNTPPTTEISNHKPTELENSSTVKPEIIEDKKIEIEVPKSDSQNDDNIFKIPQSPVKLASPVNATQASTNETIDDTNKPNENVDQPNNTVQNETLISETTSQTSTTLSDMQ